MSGLIISGIPVDDPVNRAHAARMGVPDDAPWPAPYKNSVQMDCYLHGGRIWVGPELQKARTLAVDEGDDPPVLCLLCVALVANRDLAVVKLTVVKLTGKKEGE